MRFSSCFFNVLFLVLAELVLVPAHAEESTQTSTTSLEGTTWKKIKSRLRVRTFTEVMGPAASGAGNSIPASNGVDELDPNNAFSILWTDYEVAKNTRILYFQRMQTNLNANIENPSGTTISDPRFALRKMNVWNVKGLSTTYDLYFHPGITEGSQSMGRDLEIGIQTAHTYEIAKTRWTLGFLFDARTGIYNTGGTGGSRVSGFAAPWASYNISDRWVTQHWANFTYRFLREPAPGASTLQWGYPFMPYVQNGLGYQVNPHVWVAGLVNNYLGVSPTLKNTWASLWVALTVL